jgi:hypothetical protein
VHRDLGTPDPRWLSSPLETGGPPALWVERAGAYSLVDVMVLDRAAFAARAALHRTRGRGQHGVDDPAAVETVLDADVPERDRLRAAGLLRLPGEGVFRAIACPGDPGRIETVAKTRTGRTRETLAPDDRLRAGHGRTGIGPAVGLADLPASWAQAKRALAFAAEGTEHDPGPSVVVAEELGLLALLPAALDPAGPPSPDVLALEAAAAEAPWVLSTLEAFTAHASLRLAAASLFLHHSTLQSRIASIEQDLKWSVRDPQGRLRVQLALAVRRFLLHPQH